MRDIKFKGKDYNNKWRYGDLVQEKWGQGKAIMIKKDKTAWSVLEETIGQYTGLKDKNGKEIWEGDIVTGKEYPFIEEEKQNYVGIVVFYEDVAQFGYRYKCVNKNKRGISNGINNEFQANDDLICEDLEVIGNIYENSNLLED